MKQPKYKIGDTVRVKSEYYSCNEGEIKETLWNHILNTPLYIIYGIITPEEDIIDLIK